MRTDWLFAMLGQPMNLWVLQHLWQGGSCKIIYSLGGAPVLFLVIGETFTLD